MEVLNINVGILGHVDSGKTSLVKALSTVLSTASLDKHPQSRERGITLDLGFSAFSVPLPEHLPQDKYSNLQFTLVDCPGHASLIRTIIGGAQIMDLMLLVVDATKGMQAQTTECVVIGEAVMSKGASVIVVLNKVDLIPEEERRERICQAKKDIAARLEGTKLSRASFVSCAAAVGGEKTAATPAVIAWPSKGKSKKGINLSGVEGGAAGGSVHDLGATDETAAPLTKGEPDKTVGSGCASGHGSTGRTSAPDTSQEETSTMGVDCVVAELTRLAGVPERRASAPLYFAFDHCFSVRGKGTIITGTVLTGALKVNQLVELPALRLQKKVKSMQMFHKPVSIARAGDRVGVCLSSLDAKLLERGVLATPGSLKSLTTAVALVRKVPAFNGQCRSGTYCHVSLGHTTAMATATFFGASELKSRPALLFGDTGAEGEGGETKTTSDGSDNKLSVDEVACLPFPWEAEFVQQTRLVGQVQLASEDPFVDDGCECPQDHGGDALQYCHLAFHTPVISPQNSVVVGSRLDTSGPASANTSVNGTGGLTGSGAGDGQCRIAFHGRLVAVAAGGSSKTPGDAGAGIEFGTKAGQLKLFTEKVKTGVVSRMGVGTTAAARAGGMADVYGKDLFKKETNMSPFAGMILLSEGNSVGHIEGAFGKAGRFKARFRAGSSIKVGDKLVLRFRKYFRDPSKRMDQDYLRKAVQQRQQAEEQAVKCKQLVQRNQTSAPSGGVNAMEVENESHLRTGIVESIKDGQGGSAGSCIAVVSGLFSQAEDIRALAKLGIAVRTTSSMDTVMGDVRGPFGKVGKCKVEFARGGTLQVGDQVFVPR